MTLDFDWQQAIDRHYPEGTRCRDILLKHSRSVADKALATARLCSLDLPEEEIEAAAMIHDIGIFLTNAPAIDCHGTLPYLVHGRAGADLLRDEGAPEWLARIAERHTGAGISAEEITLLDMPLPLDRDYMPRTLLERLVCYADKFYSKTGDMQEKSLERVRASIARFGSASLQRFNALHDEFTPKA